LVRALGAMLKLAPEGYPYIVIFGIASAVTAFFGNLWISTIPFVCFLFMLFFFRDPDRMTPEGRGIIYAPADGKVIFIKKTVENELLKEQALEVSIFMSPLDVHINRSPCKGVIKKVQHYPGKYGAAFKHGASLLNEHTIMVIETDYGNVAVRQVAGFLARRIVCRLKPGDIVEQGQRYGLIKFSSRLDVFLPLNAQVNVQLNDKVRAGETVLGIVK
jgi:phosphatidylserine decarboxylase